MKSPMPYIKNSMWFMLGVNTVLLLIDLRESNFGLCFINASAMVLAVYALSRAGEDHVQVPGDSQPQRRPSED